MTALLVVVALTIITSAACSVAEAALYSVPVSHIEALERRRRPSGRILNALRGRVDRPIAAILSLNTIANTGGAAVAGALVARVLGAEWIGYFSAAFTLAILMFAEVLPKTVGVVYARPIATLMARPLQLLVVVFAPFIWLTRFGTKLVLSGEHEHRVSDEDLLVLVRLGLRSGAFKPHEAQVIQNVLALEVKTAREVLTPRPVVFALPAASTVREAISNDALTRYSRVPVWDDGPEDLIGIAHRVDILTALAEDRFDVTLEDLMRPIDFVVDTTPLDRLLRVFLERRQHLVAVIDEFGGLAGIVTLEDVLEEIIGREIVDESDEVSDMRQFAHERREELLRRRNSV